MREREQPDCTEQEDEGPWLSGMVTCEYCGAQWAAVRPIGTVRLECFACMQMTEDPAGRHMVEGIGDDD